MLNRKQLLISLAVAVLATACSDEVEKKDPAASAPPFDCATLNEDGKFFCLSQALAGIETPDVACATDTTSIDCGKSRFFYDGFGGYVYPQPVLRFFNDMYAFYVSDYYAANKNSTQPLPQARHFGELFGLIYENSSSAETPEDIDAHANPIGIVEGGTLALSDTVSVQYQSESCAMCHFDQPRDGFYRYGAAHVDLKYGALKLAMSRFVCYVEDDRDLALISSCAADDLDDAAQAECDAFNAFLGSAPNASLRTLWRRLDNERRAGLLTQLRSAVPGADTACEAVEQMTGTLTDDQVVDIAQWDSGDRNASRIDRFYGSVTTAAGVASRTLIDDGVHAPVKIPHLGNLVSEGASDNSGQFLGSGVVSSLEHYVRLHVALVGGDNTSSATRVQDADLVGLTAFLRTFELPALDIDPAIRTAAEQQKIDEGDAAFDELGCADCHSVTGHDDEVVNYTATVGTDFSYALMLGGAGATPPNLTPGDTWNVAVGGMKKPHLQGLWAYGAFLHNAMAFSLESLFCLSARPLMTTDTPPQPVYEAPFLDDGHKQTCVQADGTEIDRTKREAIIAYLKTL